MIYSTQYRPPPAVVREMSAGVSLAEPAPLLIRHIRYLPFLSTYLGTYVAMSSNGFHEGKSLQTLLHIITLPPHYLTQLLTSEGKDGANRLQKLK